MRLTLLHQHHHNPDCPATCRHYTFMEALAQRHNISLITSSAWRQHRITQDYSWVPDGVTLFESDVPYKNKMNVPQRLFSYSRFAAYCLTKGLTGLKPDAIWAVATPLSTPWVAARVAALRSVPWVFEVQDLWPSFPIAMGAVKNKWLQRRLYQQERSLYHSASHIITLSPDMTDYIAELGVPRQKITTNLNGTDLHLAQQVTNGQVEALRQQLQLQGKQVVLYAGTYGRANDIPTILEAVAALADNTAIQFVFTGGGYYEPQVQEVARKHPNLTLVPPLPRHKVFTLFKLATLSLVTFNDLPVLQTNSPAKFYDSLVCGTPVIVTNPGWTKTFVERFGCGWYTPAESAVNLSLTIRYALENHEELRAAGARGAMVAKKQFDRLSLVMQVEEVLKNVVK
ncbi:glycosyltransferase family 4 protein [Pontibacter qinzhouensis]|uniref:Glycosyltransferase family 4 protein n=1 Tax=Pontibacter qinzhouensis TaxID=2603253 RepID=A0A5C8JIJ4_9BACT|nr:glycosyltransferase family 4 protein [Pontibacter qinzhouensis]TXK37262.1 glycosyltransferase family 4 protein [Pontibacter qinzhouensis]